MNTREMIKELTKNPNQSLPIKDTQILRLVKKHVSVGEFNFNKYFKYLEYHIPMSDPACDTKTNSIKDDLVELGLVQRFVDGCFYPYLFKL